MTINETLKCLTPLPILMPNHSGGEFKLKVQYSFTSTEIIRIRREGDPSTATSTFTQLLCSENLRLTQPMNIQLRTHTPRTLRLQNDGAHFFFLKFNITLRPQRP